MPFQMIPDALSPIYALVLFWHFIGLSIIKEFDRQGVPVQTLDSIRSIRTFSRYLNRSRPVHLGAEAFERNHIVDCLNKVVS